MKLKQEALYKFVTGQCDKKQQQASQSIKPELYIENVFIKTELIEDPCLFRNEDKKDVTKNVEIDYQPDKEHQKQQFLTDGKAQMLICQVCGVSVHSSVFKKHYRLKHDRDTTFHCDRCEFKTFNKESILTHVRTHVPPEYRNKYYCESCSAPFLTRAGLRIHYQSQHKTVGKPWKCTFDGCLKSFKSTVNLNLHVMFNHSERRFVCEICNKGFVYNSLLKKHTKFQHTENYPTVCCEGKYHTQYSNWAIGKMLIYFYYIF